MGSSSSVHGVGPFWVFHLPWVGIYPVRLGFALLNGCCLAGGPVTGVWRALPCPVGGGLFLCLLQVLSPHGRSALGLPCMPGLCLQWLHLLPFLSAECSAGFLPGIFSASWVSGVTRMAGAFLGAVMFELIAWPANVQGSTYYSTLSRSVAFRWSATSMLVSLGLAGSLCGVGPQLHPVGWLGWFPPWCCVGLWPVSVVALLWPSCLPFYPRGGVVLWLLRFWLCPCFWGFIMCASSVWMLAHLDGWCPVLDGGQVVFPGLR